MKVCIVGAGAIGGFIGTRLALTGQHQVAALARGATLAALQAQGWRMRLHGQDPTEPPLQAPARAADQAAALGVQDLVVIAVKGQSLGAVAPQLGPLIGPQTVLLPAMNGVPWWFHQTVPGMDPAPLDSVDPGGHIAAALPLDQVLACVVHASTSCPEPGLVLHRMGQGLVVGEPGGGLSPRVLALGEVLTAAGFQVKQSENVRQDIWYKLWGNLTMNPVSALTGATMDKVLGDPLVRAFCSVVMDEATALGALLGCSIRETPESRHAVTEKLGPFKTSMLQDVEAGRPIELDSIVTAVQELGRRVGLPTPNIDALLGLTRLFAQTRGLYPVAAPQAVG